MARKIDLRTGRPVWTAYRAPRVPVRSLRKDLKTDVLIVGMGISGAMLAEALTADGHAVVAIDRRGPMLGSTAAATAAASSSKSISLWVRWRIRSERKPPESAWRRSASLFSTCAPALRSLACAVISPCAGRSTLQGIS